MNPYINDQSSDPPKLKVYLNLDNLVGLPADSVWEEVSGDAVWQRLQADGFTGVQLTDFETACPPDFLGYGGLDRINHPEETEVVFARHAERGDAFLTLHVGWGMESDQEMDALVSTILTAQNQYNLPTFIETHRATITQDMWRTVELTKRFPAVRFNGDFSQSTVISRPSSRSCNRCLIASVLCMDALPLRATCRRRSRHLMPHPVRPWAGITSRISKAYGRGPWLGSSKTPVPAMS